MPGTRCQTELVAWTYVIHDITNLETITRERPKVGSGFIAVVLFIVLRCGLRWGL